MTDLSGPAGTGRPQGRVFIKAVGIVPLSAGCAFGAGPRQRDQRIGGGKIGSLLADQNERESYSLVGTAIWSLFVKRSVIEQ